MRITPVTLRNLTFILLYYKVPKHHAKSNIPRHQSVTANLVSGNGKHEKPLKEVNRILKK